MTSKLTFFVLNGICNIPRNIGEFFNVFSITIPLINCFWMILKQTRVLHHVVSFLQLLFIFHIFIATRFEYCPYAALQKLLMNVNFELI
jgi:hypothetical protein